MTPAYKVISCLVQKVHKRDGSVCVAFTQGDRPPERFLLFLRDADPTVLKLKPKHSL